MPALYPLFKRKSSNSYYVQFRDQDGKRLAPRSTGQRLKKDAEEWAAREFRKNGYRLPLRSMKFGDYAKPWWKPQECLYVRR